MGSCRKKGEKVGERVGLVWLLGQPWFVFTKKRQPRRLTVSNLGWFQCAIIALLPNKTRKTYFNFGVVFGH